MTYFIKLQINGSNIDFELLNEKIGIAPTFMCKKGTKSVHGRTEVTACNDTWIYDVTTDEFSIEFLSKFVEKFSGCAGLFDDLKKLGIVSYLVITYYVDKYQAIFSLPNELIQLIAGLNLELCFDIMCLEQI